MTAAASAGMNAAETMATFVQAVLCQHIDATVEAAVDSHLERFTVEIKA
jgi:hypothetical protein